MKQRPKTSIWSMPVSKLSLSERRISTKTICNKAIIANPISREIKQIATEAEAMAVDLSNSEDVAMEGPIIKIAMERISISITHMTHNQSNMAHPAVYAADLITSLSTATRENMT